MTSCGSGNVIPRVEKTYRSVCALSTVQTGAFG